MRRRADPSREVTSRLAAGRAGHVQNPERPRRVVEELPVPPAVSDTHGVNPARAPLETKGKPVPAMVMPTQHAPDALESVVGEDVRAVLFSQRLEREQLAGMNQPRAGPVLLNDSRSMAGKMRSKADIDIAGPEPVS